MVTRLWESLCRVLGFLRGHSQESEPSQEKGADCDPADLVYGAGNGDGGAGFPSLGGREEERDACFTDDLVREES